MRINIRPAALDSDRAAILETLSRYLDPPSNERRFTWLYGENPHGQARAWLACESSDSSVVGMAAAFPRRMLVHGVATEGWVLGDFCVSDRHRSLGPALQLQRACLAGLDGGGMATFYDFPSENMMAVYRRLGFKSQGRLVRFAKPLRGDRKIREKIKVRWLVRSLGSLANSVLSLQARTSRSVPDGAISVHQGPCGQQFSSLARKVSPENDVCVQRSAEYLNWRYLAHPYRTYRILKLERKTELLAYIVFTQTKADASIADLLGMNDSNLLAAVLQALVNLLRDAGVSTVSVPLLDSHPWASVFRKLGFYPRESCAVVLQHATRTVGTGSEQWFLMDGDRES